MSYEKQTINLSTINTTVEILQEENIPFKLTNITSVIGQGINDEEWGYNAEGEPRLKQKIYLIRKLEYGNIIVVEQMKRTHDRDSNDFLVSMKFDKNIFGSYGDLRYEIYTDEETETDIELTDNSDN